MEPIEQLVVDIEEQAPGRREEKLGTRKGQLKNMEPDGKGRVRPESHPIRMRYALYELASCLLYE